MAFSKERLVADKKYDAENYERLTVKVRQEWTFRDIVKQAATACGESVNGYMVKAIRDKVEADGFAFPVPVLPDKQPKDE